MNEMLVIEGATVDHVPERIEWKTAREEDTHAVAKCGETGEPVKKNVDVSDLCRRCRPDLFDPEDAENDEYDESEQKEE